MEREARNIEDVIDMMVDRSPYDAMTYRGVRFSRAWYRAPGGGPLTRAEARRRIKEETSRYGE